MFEWFEFGARWLIFPVGLVAAYEGTRRLILRSRAYFWIGAAGLIVLLLASHGATLIWRSSVAATLLQPLGQELVYRPTKEQLAALPAHERESKSLLLARMNFHNRGVLTTYFKASGQEVIFVPSEADISERDRLQGSIAETRARLEGQRLLGCLIIFSIVVALLAGSIAGGIAKRA